MARIRSLDHPHSLTVGLSDPSEWHPENGEAADPSVIPGAFADDTGYLDELLFNHHQLMGLSSPPRTAAGSKRIDLPENGIQVLYQTHTPVSTRIPLALDPQAFYSGPTNYLAVLAPHSWTWSLIRWEQCRGPHRCSPFC